MLRRTTATVDGMGCKCALYTRTYVYISCQRRHAYIYNVDIYIFLHGWGNLLWVKTTSKLLKKHFSHTPFNDFNLQKNPEIRHSNRTSSDKDEHLISTAGFGQFCAFLRITRTKGQCAGIYDWTASCIPILHTVWLPYFLENLFCLMPIFA
jgi:hypothetical protein